MSARDSTIAERPSREVLVSLGRLAHRLGELREEADAIGLELGDLIGRLAGPMPSDEASDAFFTAFWNEVADSHSEKA